MAFIFLFPLQPACLYSQSPMATPAIAISFNKDNITLPEATTVFNIIKIENNSGELLQGGLSIRLPEGWSMIGPAVSDVTVNPGETAYFPVRAGLPRTTAGGISYVIYAELATSGKSYSASAYVSVEKKSKWDMKVLNSTIYLSEFRPVGKFSLALNNKGNAREMIRLTFDIGSLLEFRTFIEADSIMFIELPAWTDTILNFEIFRRRDLSYAETRALMRSWKSTSIYITASTSDHQDYSGVRVTPLESSMYNDLPVRNSPLNFEFTTYNLLAQQRPKASMKAFGRVLFPENQQVQYSFGMYNLYFTPERYQNFDLYQQLRYMVRYDDRKSSIWIGDRLGTGNLHTMTGSGVKAEYNVKDDQTISMNLIYNPYGGNIGTFAGYATRIGRVSVNAGATVERSENNINGYNTLHLGGAFRFLSHHTLRLQTATTYSSFSKGSYLAKDTATLGFAYRLSYLYNDRRFRFRVDNTNTSFTYLNNAGINRINSELSWEITQKSRLAGMYYRNNYNPTHYPYNFYYPENRSINENGRLLYSYTDGNIIYQAGPQYFSTVRYNINRDESLSSEYKNYEPGILGSITFRLGEMKTITPNLAVNTMYYSYMSGAADGEPVRISGRWQYTAGLSYYDQAFRLSAYYSSGDASEIYRDLVVNEKPVISQAIYIRPSYERYFNHDKIKLNASYSYSFFMPSQRENTIASVISSFFLKDGWTLFGSLNVYKNSRNDSETGRITTRNLNVLAGFRKAFGIQQPRMKYYDIVVKGFNDQDGNGIKDENEKPVSNILIKLKRDPKKNGEDKEVFAETNLITDPNGEISYRNIPEGNYDLEITPLSNMEDLYFLEGRNQHLTADKDRIQYLPLVESYKVKGRVIVNRDPNSNAGRISMEGIRITALGSNGLTYSVLTDNTGAYVLNLPKAENYTVSIYNVFGERFMLQQPSYEVRFMENRTINIDFQFDEVRREIRFNNDSQLYDFQLRKE